MSPIHMQRVESGMRAMIAFTEAHNRHDLDAMMELVSDKCIFETTTPAPDGTLCQGKESITQYWRELLAHSPDACIKIEDIFGFGLRCILLWSYSWIDEAGNKRHLRGVDICRVQDGIIQEVKSYIKG